MVYVKLSNMVVPFAPPNDFAPLLISGGGEGMSLVYLGKEPWDLFCSPFLSRSSSSRLSCKKDILHFPPAEPIQLPPHATLDLCTTDRYYM